MSKSTSKPSSISFLLSSPQETTSTIQQPTRSPSIPSAKRPRRDSMDTTTPTSPNTLNLSSKSPRTTTARLLSPSSASPSLLDPPYSTPNTSEKLSKKQRKFLRQWHETLGREAPSRPPSSETLTALATLVQARPGIVYAYLTTELPGSFSTPTPPSTNTPQTSLSPCTLPADSHISAATQNLITKYLSTCARRRSPTDGRRRINSGPLRCTFGCGYRTARPFDWRRHEETHAPQGMWVCTLCGLDAGAVALGESVGGGGSGSVGTVTTTKGTASAASPFLSHRKDKFLKHVRDAHSGWEGETVLGISRVEVRAGGADGGLDGWRCPFCRAESGGWEERCRHVLGHFESGEVGRGRGKEGEGRGEGAEESEDGSEVNGGESSGEDERVVEGV